MNINELFKSDNLLQKWYILGSICPFIVKDKSENGKLKVRVCSRKSQNSPEWAITEKEKINREMALIYTKTLNLKFEPLSSSTGWGCTASIEIDSPLDGELWVKSFYSQVITVFNDDFKQSGKIVLEYFYLGMFDSRGSIDLTANYFTIDVKKEILIDFLDFFVKIEAIVNGAAKGSGQLSYHNLNARSMQPSESSKKKNTQFRVNLQNTLSKIGVLSIYKQILFNIRITANKGFAHKYSHEKYKNEKGILKYSFKYLNKAKESSVNNEVSKRKIELILDYTLKDMVKSNTELNSATVKIMNKINKIEKKRRKFSLEDKLMIFEKFNNKCFYSLCAYEAKNKKSGLPNLELNHIIPFAKNDLIKKDIDVLENLIPLCSNHHSLITYIKGDEESQKIYLEMYKYLRENTNFLEGVDLKTFIDFY